MEEVIDGLRITIGLRHLAHLVTHLTHND